MACASCGTHNDDGSPAGCGSKGHCSSGGCNRMSTYDWLAIRGVRDVADQHYVEVSFKHGTRKEFFACAPALGASTGDVVVVDAEAGTDTGYVTLSGELVLAQMRRRKTKPSRVRHDVIRLAHARDLARLDEARRVEMATLVRARAIAYATDLPLKMSDVEYRGDLRKATFYYTSEQRIDFRGLIRDLASEFKVRVEMRQIGARQEAARIGGIGSCGRELCCSTWLTDFKSVNTSAARYQGLALNQTKLSGQCGRLKCCLNYELDTYLDALDDFPKKADKIRLPSGKAVLVKTDVFKRLMYYQVMKGRERGPFVTMTVEQVRAVLADPEADVHTLAAIENERQLAAAAAEADEHDYGDVTGVVDIPLEKRGRKKRGRGKQGGGGQGGGKREGGSGKREGGGGKREGRGRSGRGQGQGRPAGEGGKAKASGGDDRRREGSGGGAKRGRGRRKPRGPKPGGGGGAKS